MDDAHGLNWPVGGVGGDTQRPDPSVSGFSSGLPASPMSVQGGQGANTPPPPSSTRLQKLPKGFRYDTEKKPGSQRYVNDPDTKVKYWVNPESGYKTLDNSNPSTTVPSEDSASDVESSSAPSTPSIPSDTSSKSTTSIPKKAKKHVIGSPFDEDNPENQ